MNNLICFLFGHEDRKWRVWSNKSMSETLGMIRVKICDRCKRWDSI